MKTIVTLPRYWWAVKTPPTAEDNNELITKGFDEKMNMNYYKVYFREEN
ncbi:MAG: hypothetical protein KGM16_03670 [Bacteroidota bacterium]|nr:hypothetical protein [Bacteroidota bacterium]